MAALHPGEISDLLAGEVPILIDSHESAKSLRGLEEPLGRLLEKGVRKTDVLIAVGGGIVQDVVCFLASTMFRGMDWSFVPTTVLAQADSCIGSKSCVNAPSAKNVLGTIHGPREVVIWGGFRTTLAETEIRSGIGEMIKIHVLEGRKSFEEIAAAHPELLLRDSTMEEFIGRSLLLKRRWVEEDEFDRGPRNLLNYGHSFGHAIEAASDFSVAHGLAVTIGMDMANSLSARIGRIPERERDRMRATLVENVRGVDLKTLSAQRVLDAMARDKKRVGERLALILLGPGLRAEKVEVPCDADFERWCSSYLEGSPFGR
ncbi:MAG: 3-dehydroquinate synthase [Myxococcota bacterium]